MGKAHVVPDGKWLRDGHEPDQTMLKLLPLSGRGNPRKHTQAFVDLKRIAGDGDRVLALLTKLPSESQGDPVFPTPVGPNIATTLKSGSGFRRDAR